MYFKETTSLDVQWTGNKFVFLLLFLDYVQPLVFPTSLFLEKMHYRVLKLGVGTPQVGFQGVREHSKVSDVLAVLERCVCCLCYEL